MPNEQLKREIAKLPRMVRKITGQYNAWIVGGAASPHNANPRDYDVAVSYTDWKQVAFLIPPDAKPTLFGGWKFESDGKMVDLWPDDIINIFLHCKCEWMWQPRFNIRIAKI